MASNESSSNLNEAIYEPLGDLSLNREQPVTK